MAEKANGGKGNMRKDPQSYNSKTGQVEKNNSSLENNAEKDKNLKAGIEESLGGIVVREEDLGDIQYRWV